MLNHDQKVIFEEVIAAVEKRSNQILFYIDGPGGSGKTYLNNTLLTYARSQGHKSLAVASTGIASTLLLGGNTAHSQFEIPIDLSEYSTCNITKQSKLGKLLQSVEMIIWDEAPMTHRFAFEALDRTLRDLRNSQEPMGGIITVLCGDFRQILPIIPKGSRPDIVNATLKRSALWKHVKHMTLNKNMRLNEDSQRWNDLILQIGNGVFPSKVIDEEQYIEMPDQLLLPPHQDINDLISSIYGQQIFYPTQEQLRDCIILTPRNKDAQMINNSITEKIQGHAKIFKSADSTCNEASNNCILPEEFLNSLNPSGVPPHELILKVGIPIVLIRTIAPKAGLHNGTRLRIDALQQFVITATILSGQCKGNQVKIPRIDVYFKQPDLPFTLIRRQFPILVAFAMTINRSQGQGFENVGIYLRYPVFSHGQLYVAMSRCKSIHRLKLLIEHEPYNHRHTKNIVYQEVLNL
jgi:hypothetical protein